MAGRWLILADDLTGAADCAIAFGRRGLPAAVTWGEVARGEARGVVPRDLAVLSYDADSRGLSAPAAAERHADLLRRLLEPERVLFKKIDSTLRGQPAAETAATLACLKARTGAAFGICAPAFPATGRTTVAGRVRVDGRPLEEAEVWRRDHSYPSADLEEVLGGAGIATQAVPLADIRAPDLAARLARIAEAGASVAICDAETDADLAAIAAASLRLAPSPFFIGSAGLAHALAGVLEPVATAPVRVSPNPAGSLIVVGSLAAASRAATRRLAARDGVVHLPVPPHILLDDPAGRAALAERVAAVIASGADALVEIAMGADLDMALGPRLARGLAEALDPVAGRIGAFAATGGETAAALLARFGVDGIRLVDEIEPGVSLGLTLGRLSVPVATKAGAFGDADSLIRIGERLRAVRLEGRFS
ncbi:four-carbon acid sugar kinase family protein [Methylobacterium sp. J-068]|uniref:four-carbon acid sugar kinase family protein n=1 Tax=Methylobacterium sp. J-068 TaxID=2836649 RepID=UPI001FBA3627|nr:four-carbon acid sugar kinase family protein [Methylobacterium sp. J-068]MCJ2037065.1 four-carbon acid sugar kinase family protein [Methylobacterium sp. J-068]